MKVHELVEALMTMPWDAEVTTEGCDCDGDVGSVELYAPKEVYLRRGGGQIILREASISPERLAEMERFKDVLP